MPDNVDIGGQSTMPVVSVADGRAVVRLNRPREHNRLEPADLGVLRATFGRVDADPTIRVLILTGTGKSFSSGFHIGALADPWPARAGRRRNATASSAWSTGSRHCASRRSPPSTAVSTAVR